MLPEAKNHSRRSNDKRRLNAMIDTKINNCVSLITRTFGPDCFVGVAFLYIVQNKLGFALDAEYIEGLYK